MMSMMIDNPAIPLSFIAGPAILANSCAIIQNGASTRYNLAVTQWREFQTSVSTQNDHLARLYSSPQEALRLAQRRITLQLREIELMLCASSTFALTSLLALTAAILAQLGSGSAGVAISLMLVSGGAGFLLLLIATVAIFMEGACSRRLIRLHPVAS